MVSREDRRRLDAIAQSLERDDPDLARRLSEPAAPPATLLDRLSPTVLVVVGVLGLLAGLLLGSGTLILVIGFAPLIAAFWLSRRARPGHFHRDPD